MRIFILVAFWLGMIDFIGRMLALVVSEFPVARTVKLGEHLFALIWGILFLIWAGILLWA